MSPRYFIFFILSLGNLYAEEEMLMFEPAEYYDDGDPYGLELKRTKVEEDTPTKRHAKMGNADVTVEVKNIERFSENEQKKDFLKKKAKGKEEENNNPEASISIKWKVGG